MAQATQRIESLLLADRQELEDALEFERKRAESLEAGFYSMESKVESADLRVRREIENELRLVQVILDNYKGFELEDLKDKGPEAYGQLYEHAENMLRNLRQIQQILLENKLVGGIVMSTPILCGIILEPPYPCGAPLSPAVAENH